MALFDLMFPYKYKNIPISIAGHAFNVPIMEATMTALRNA